MIQDIPCLFISIYGFRDIEYYYNMHFKLRSLFATVYACKNQGEICTTYPTLYITRVIPTLGPHFNSFAS